jgi:catechol 2,3-dioxygenase-like lactoylglutathione lyase family enzyme
MASVEVSATAGLLGGADPADNEVERQVGWSRAVARRHAVATASEMAPSSHTTLVGTYLTRNIMLPRTPKTRFEGAQPILRVADMEVSLHYYVEVLGFRNADWGTDAFTSVNRDAAGLYLCRGGQGCSATWAWIGSDDVAALYDEYKATGATIRHAPRNYLWALEMHVRDPDGHVLRFGSEPLVGQPFDSWMD